MPANRLIVVGKVLGPKGLKGEIKVEPISDSPGRFAPGGILYAKDRPHQILRSTQLSVGQLALKLQGIDSRDDAEHLRGVTLLVPEDTALPLPEGEYYHFQILDMTVYTPEKECLGRVTEILSTGSNDVYVVSSDGKELLVPALEDVVKEVDVARKTITVELPEGLRPRIRSG